MAMAVRLAEGTLPLGEAFSFMSGLYFRGKVAYAKAFGRRVDPGPSAFVITPTRGLQPPDVLVDRNVIEEFGALDVAHDEPRYRDPLVADARALAAALADDARVVLLGSVATAKYLDVLASTFQSRLYFPSAFIGRGDMSRGGLMLRSAEFGRGARIRRALGRDDAARAAAAKTRAAAEVPASLRLSGLIRAAGLSQLLNPLDQRAIVRKQPGRREARNQVRPHWLLREHRFEDWRRLCLAAD